jgi:hypothetical protein
MSDILGYPQDVGVFDPAHPRQGPQLNEVLRRYGLESLAGWASRAVINGWSPEQIMLELYQRPEFKTRFSGIFVRESKGLPPMSVDEYLQYESTVHALANTYGMPLSKTEIDDMIGNDVSAMEVERRINIAATAVYDSDAETKAEMERLFGVGTGQLMKYWMDPKKELPALQTQYRQAEIAGAALRTGYNQLTQSQTQRLQEVGLTRDQAAQGFGQLAAMDELFNPMDMGEVPISQDMQIDFLAGNADAAQAIEDRVEKRQAEFEGGGQFASGREGFATGSAD